MIATPLAHCSNWAPVKGAPTAPPNPFFQSSLVSLRRSSSPTNPPLNSHSSWEDVYLQLQGKNAIKLLAWLFLGLQINDSSGNISGDQIPRGEMGSQI